MQSLSKYNKGIEYLLCAIELICLVNMDSVNAFHKIISKGRKPNRIWFDQGGEFYNNLLKKFLKINIIKMYST